jgi:hypothetical protein
MDMKKKDVGLLLGVGAGLGLVWFCRNQIAAMFDKRVDLEVEDQTDGPRVVEVLPETVTVKHNGHVRWTVHNHSQQDVMISLQDWQDSSHEPVAPAVDPAPDDNEQPPQDGLSRKVPAGKKRPIRGRARKPQKDGAEVDEEEVKYAIFLDGGLAVDPIVKLVL